MLTTLGQLKQLIREDLEDRRAFIIGDFEDAVTSGGWYNQRNHYVAFKVRDAWEPDARLSRASALAPKDVLKAIKTGAPVQSKGKTWEVPAEVIDEATSRMARKIAEAFYANGISAVAHVPSSSPLSANLAQRVASALNVLYLDITRLPKPEELEIDEYEFSRYQKKHTPEEAANFRQQLETNLQTMRNAAAKGKRVSMARNVDPRRRKYFKNLLVVDMAKHHPRVLMVDDNLDTGATLASLATQLMGLEVEPYTAAGYKLPHK